MRNFKVKEHKLRWFGYVTRSSGMAKTIHQKQSKVTDAWGGEKNTWEDICEWTGLKMRDAVQAAKNGDGYRDLDIILSVMPRGSARL